MGSPDVRAARKREERIQRHAREAVITPANVAAAERFNLAAYPGLHRICAAQPHQIVVRFL